MENHSTLSFLTGAEQRMGMRQHQAGGFVGAGHLEVGMLPGIERQGDGGRRCRTEEPLHLDLAAGQCNLRGRTLDRIEGGLSIALAQRLDDDTACSGFPQHVADVAGQDRPGPTSTNTRMPSFSRQFRAGSNWTGSRTFRHQ